MTPRMILRELRVIEIGEILISRWDERQLALLRVAQLAVPPLPHIRDEWRELPLP
jgi:hypothetical protein